MKVQIDGGIIICLASNEMLVMKNYTYPGSGETIELCGSRIYEGREHGKGLAKLIVSFFSMLFFLSNLRSNHSLRKSLHPEMDLPR